MVKSAKLGMSISSTKTRDFSYRYTWMTLKMAGKKQNMAPMWKKLIKNVDLDEPTSFLDHENLGCAQRECKSSYTKFQVLAWMTNNANRKN